MFVDSFYRCHLFNGLVLLGLSTVELVSQKNSILLIFASNMSGNYRIVDSYLHMYQEIHCWVCIVGIAILNLKPAEPSQVHS